MGLDFISSVFCLFFNPAVISRRYAAHSVKQFFGTERAQLKWLRNTSSLRGTKAFYLAHVLHATIPAVNALNQ